jgi:hypothetical protein
MPFRIISRAQAERRQARRSTRQGSEIKSLGARYETAQKAAREGFRGEQQGLLSDFQQKMETYGKEMSVFEQSAKDFQAKSDEYNKKLESFQQVTPLPGTFTALPIKGKPGTYLTSSNIKSMEEAQVYNMDSALGKALSGVAGVDTETWARDGATRIKGFDADKLPSNYVLKQTGFSKGGYQEFQIAQRGAEDPGEFTDKFEAAAPEAPAYEGPEGLTEKYSAALKQEQDFFEREIGERKLASQRARRRVGDRPMLTGERP